MSEDTDFTDDELYQEDEVVETRNPARELQRKMEKELKESKAQLKLANDAKSEGESAKRELAFLKAGIDTSTGTGKLLAKSYEGELTVEAIKAQAEEYGLIPTSQTSEVSQEIAAIDRVSAASSTSTGSLPPSAENEMRNATTPEDVMALARKFGIPISDEEPGQPYSIV